MQAALGLLLIATVATLTNGLAANSNMKWRVPLGVGANENTGTLSLAGDDSTLFTADTRGTIFAVEARTGRVRWSIAGSDALDQLFVFPSIPDLLYYTAWDLAIVGQLTLHAVRKEDGVEVARLRNLSTGDVFAATYAKVISTNYGLAILHKYGLYSTDSHLNVQWQVDNPFGAEFTGQYFTHLAASGSLIATVARDEIEVEGRAVSFDAKTGRVVCNISNVTSSILDIKGAPFVITEDGWSVLDYTRGVPDFAYLLPRAVDLTRCSVFKTERISDAALWGGVSIIPRTSYSDPSQQTLFFGFSREPLNSSLYGNWTITRSKIGSNDTIWNLTLPATVVNPDVIGGLGQPPLITKASGISDAVLLWYLGSFSAIDTATGAVRWSLAPTTVPTSPPFSLMDPQTVFPLGDGGRLFVPNLLGYTIVDTYTGDLLEANFNDPIVSTLQFRDSNGNGYVAYVNAYGAVVGTH